MQFQTPAQKACFEKVAPWMKEIFGPRVIANPDVPMFEVHVGEARAQVRVLAWGEDDATISTRATLGLDLTAAEDLWIFLLRANGKMRFGAFGIDADGQVFFEHTFVGTHCGLDELKGSVMAVISTTDQYTQVISARWGKPRPQ